MTMDPCSIARRLGRAVDGLRFGPPVAHVYNPLIYAAEAHIEYLDRYCRPGTEVLLLGMNPGPWGMAQTGVPFGEVSLVRDWLGIRDGVDRPGAEHPKRPIQGFDCRRSEVSGQRLWGWARDRFGSPEAFFARFFVWNYCPLAFLEESGRNRTPDRLPAKERKPLFEGLRPRPGGYYRIYPAFDGAGGGQVRSRSGPRRGGRQGGSREHPAPQPGQPGGEPGLGGTDREATAGVWGGFLTTDYTDKNGFFLTTFLSVT